MLILVVEDELKMARALRRGLEQEGYSVELSADGSDAISRVHGKEFDAIVLDVMMRHPCEVLPRRRILEHGWDDNYDHFSNGVDVYVGYLRRKLEQPFGRPLIRTVRGVGYAVDAEAPSGQAGTA